jgi:hypothetical protein
METISLSSPEVLERIKGAKLAPWKAQRFGVVAYPITEEGKATLRKQQPRRPTPYAFYALPSNTGISCENQCHALHSLLTAKGTKYVDSGFSKVATGKVPADFVYYIHEFKGPKTKTGMTPVPVCGFCASEVEESWLEGEAEAMMS